MLGNKDSNFKIPSKISKERKISVLPKHLQHAVYRVVIKSNDKNFLKIFKINESNFYTHFDIQLARRFLIKYPKSLTIELIKDRKYNALVYYKDDLIDSHEIFGRWFKVVTRMKQELPENGLVKHLSSSLWGTLSKSIHFYHSVENMVLENDNDNNENLEIIDIKFVKEKQFMICIDKTKGFYKTNFRIKSFLTSYCRCKIANIILNNDLIENVIRIHTDGVILDKPFDFPEEFEFLPEYKTTGKVKFKNVNSYKKV